MNEDYFWDNMHLIMHPDDWTDTVRREVFSGKRTFGPDNSWSTKQIEKKNKKKNKKTEELPRDSQK